jgi:hypothetical protein
MFVLLDCLLKEQGHSQIGLNVFSIISNDSRLRMASPSQFLQVNCVPCGARMTRGVDMMDSFVELSSQHSNNENRRHWTDLLVE